jgi:hypothetical protein
LWHERRRCSGSSASAARSALNASAAAAAGVSACRAGAVAKSASGARTRFGAQRLVDQVLDGLVQRIPAERLRAA